MEETTNNAAGRQLGMKHKILEGTASVTQVTCLKSKNGMKPSLTLS